MKNLSIYIHIPFCVKKCHYCDFLSAPSTEEIRQKYVERLCQELRDRSMLCRKKEVDSIFFGGGTPSLLSEEEIQKIMETVRAEFTILSNAEITVEVNPGTITKEKLLTYQKLGINRLSVGLQSAENKELKNLGRIHTWESFLESFQLIRQMGFHNVNLDLMSALPGQTCASYEKTLEKILQLKPEHISAYSLIVEEGTLFYQWYGPGGLRQKELPSEEEERKMYQQTEEILKEHGYYRYEISNYALPGYECKHNIGYWKRKEYLGVGLGAASLLEIQEKEAAKTGRNCKMQRISNETSLEKYLKGNDAWEREITELSLSDEMEEFMFLGLRMMEGIRGPEFEEAFGVPLAAVYGETLDKLVRQGLMEFYAETERYALTKRGIDVSNLVFVEFIN